MEDYQIEALKGLVGTAILIALLSTVPCWVAFQVRNPTANDSAYFTHFVDVMTFQKLDKFQTK